MSFRIDPINIGTNSYNDEQAYVWTSTYSATGGQEVIYLENTSSTLMLAIDKFVASAPANQHFTLFKVTSGTPGGTSITGVNLNFSSGNSASATAYGNASVTGGLSGTNIGWSDSLASTKIEKDFKGSIILGQNDAIACTVGAGTIVFVEIYGYYI